MCNEWKRRNTLEILSWRNTLLLKLEEQLQIWENSHPLQCSHYGSSIKLSVQSCLCIFLISWVQMSPAFYFHFQILYCSSYNTSLFQSVCSKDDSPILLVRYFGRDYTNQGFHSYFEIIMVRWNTKMIGDRRSLQEIYSFLKSIMTTRKKNDLRIVKEQQSEFRVSLNEVGTALWLSNLCWNWNQ